MGGAGKPPVVPIGPNGIEQGSRIGRGMNQGATDIADPADMAAEIAQLRGEVARLTRRVEELDELAHQDALIALPNRRGFLRELDRLIARVQRYQVTAAMLFVDLDGLKMINDSFGHKAGDEALIEVASLLERGVRRSDVVARIGGDEFGILLENADEPRARDTARRLTDMIGDSGFDHDGDSLPLSVAIGVTMIGAADAAADVMARADEEMYRAKAA
jgi:diguanylate cyclase (GGDEF)-like protein